MNHLQSYKAPNLTIINGQVKTTSLAIAELFGKSHAHVLRDIETIKANCSPEFSESNFGFSVFDGLRRKEKCIDITRDGMTMIIMGYIGAEAMRFKEAYITAFNKMEAELAGLKAKPERHKPKAIKSQDIDLVKHIIHRAGDDGIAESRIALYCAGFKRLDEVERDDLIMKLVNMKEITMKINDGKNGNAGRHGKRFFIM